MAPWLRGCGILHGCIGGVVCAICVLLITTPLVACTTTFVIGTSCNEFLPNADMLLYYINGLSFATTGATEDGVSYSATFSSVGLWTQWPPIGSIASSMVQQGAVAIFGPPGTFAVADLYENQMISPNTVFFGPLAENLYSGPISFLLYQPGIFWTIPTEGAQALGLLDYLEQRPLFPQNQLMLYQWYTNSGIGCVARLLFQEVMPPLGVGGFDSCSDGGSSSSFESLSSSPRIVYLFEAYTNNDNTEDTGTSSWITNLISNPTLIAANITVATPFYIHSYVVGLYNSWHSSSPTAEMLPPQNVISSAPTPGVDSTEYSVTQDFLTNELTGYGCTNNACKNFELAGWVNAKALMHALSMYGGGSSQSPSSYFYTTLLAAESSFLVSDLFIGSFGPQAGCGTVALSQGAVCGCNQAGMNVFFMQLKWFGGVVDVVTIPGASFQYAKGKCASVVLPGSEPFGVSSFNELFSFVPMKRLVGLTLTDNTMMMDMCNSVSAVSAALSNRTLYQHLAPNGYVVYCISTTTASMSSDLTSHMSTYVTTSMTGVIPDSMIDSIATPSTFVLDFMPQTTQPRVMLQNLVYLFPTLDQELYVLASYLYGILTASSVVCGAVRTSSVSSAIVTLLTKTLTTFQLAVDSDHMVQTSGALGSSIPSACTHTFVVGLDEDDAAGVAAYLHSHTSAVVLLSFDDVTKYYSPLQTSFGGQGGSLTDRLLFATNLPSWTATPSDPTAAAASAPLSTVSQFLQSAPDSMHTPAALRAFLVAMMYDLLSAGHGSASDVQQLLYDAVTVVMDGVHFGPFSEECTAVASTCSAGWVSNAGATDIAVWSYTRVVTPSTPLMLEPATPSMIYTTARTSSTGLEASALSLPPSGRSVGDTMCVLISDSSASRNSQFTSQSTSLSGSLSSFPPTRVPLPSSSSRAYESRESLTTIDDVLVFVGVALCVMVLVVLLLRLWKSGVLFRIAKRVRYVLSCYRCNRTSRSPKGGRSSTEADCRLEQRSRDASRFVPATEEGRTIVCVIADYWRPLWVRVPEVMGQAAEYYQRSVREAVVRHGCVEMRAVDGLFTVLCPSASASMLLVLDIHQSLQSMRTVLREALTAAYRSFGVVCADVHDPQLLRVRVGVDTVAGGDGSSAGSDICTDGCVEVATRAAYRNCSGSVLCVMTKRTRSGLTDEELLSLQICGPSAGTHVLRCGQSECVMELFVVMSSASATEVSAFSSPANERSCEVALSMLSNDVDATSVSTARCTATLSALYSALPTLRVELLEAMLHSFALPVLSRSTCANDMDYANALVSALARHLGGLLECRHGIPPGLRRSGDVSGVSREEGCSVVEGHVESRASGRSGHGNLHMSGRHVRLQASNRTNTVVLRRFAYGSNHLCDASGDRVGDVQ